MTFDSQISKAVTYQRFLRVGETLASFTVTCYPTLTPLFTSLFSTPDTHRGCRHRESYVEYAWET